MIELNPWTPVFFQRTRTRI